MTTTESTQTTESAGTADPSGPAGPGREGGRRSRPARPSSRATRAAGRPAWLGGGAVAAYWALLAAVNTVAAMGFLGLFSRSLAIPLVYNGDALSGGAQFKGTIETGWYEHNPGLGAPFGQNLHDFPTADNLQFVFARVLGLVTDQWAVAYNLTYLLSYPLTAIAAAWCVRRIGGSRMAAFVFGTLFAFTPFHFIHGEPHLALSMLFVVPLWTGLILTLLADRPVWPRRPDGRWWSPLTWATPGTAVTLLILVLVGSTSSYYAVFGLILMTFAAAVLLLRRRIRRALGAVAAMAGLMAVMVLNMAPDILYQRGLTPSPAAFERQPLESEIYALKLTSLLFPVPWDRIGALSRFRLNYDGTFPLPSESPTLGLVAAVGFVFLLAVPFVVLLRNRPSAPDGPVGGTVQHLALLALVAFLFGTIGGLGSIFAQLVASDIRAWNRIVVFIALCGLLAMAVLFDRGVARVAAWLADRRERRTSLGASDDRPWRSGVAVVAGVALLAVGLYDEAAPPGWTIHASEVTDWKSDSAYVAAIEKRVPAGTAIYEIPTLPFPESLPVGDVHDYDPIRPYLHSTDLSWSYGGVKGRPRSDWYQAVENLPVLRLATVLGAAGFGGIHLDRFAYPDHKPGEVDRYLRELLGPPIVSPDGRFEFFDMAAFDQQLHQDYSAAQLASIKRHTIKSPIFYWQPGFAGPPTPDGNGHLLLAGKSAGPTAIVDNPGAPIPMKLSFIIQSVQADHYPTSVDVTWPDGVKQTISVDTDGTRVSHTFTAPTGESTLLLAGINMTSINLLDPVLRDPGLFFALRGKAADLSAEHHTQKEDQRADKGSSATKRGDGG